MTDIEGERLRPSGMGSLRRHRLRVAVTLLFILSVLWPFGGPLPVGSSVHPASAQSSPDWMTADQAALFTNDWPSLVPSYVPEPFASVAPDIRVSGGYYSLYWYVGGGTPTFLKVTGDVSGYIPAGSAYDLNVELVVNATVRGFAAYHDLTPIYDTVYWRENGIAYSVSSQNLPTDAVSYANSFMTASAPAPEPTATVAPAASLLSPDSISAGGVGTVTASGGGPGATLVADGGVFSDTGSARYPGAGDAAVKWVAPDVTEDTTVTFSLLDGNGTLLVSTPTLVTAAPAPVPVALDCAPSVRAGEPLSVSLTGSGNVMLDAGAGFWPQTSPNTDYDPGTDGATLAFTLGDGGTATLTWNAPATAQTATLSASGPSGFATASCRVEVLAAEATLAPTAPAPTGAPPTVAAPTATTAAPTATTGSEAPLPETPVPTATAVATNPGDGTAPGDGIVPGDGIDPGGGTDPGAAAARTPTVPGTNPGDGIDPGQPVVTPPPVAPSPAAGDGTDFGGAGNLPPRATYPAIPTSAPLPDAPPTSVPPPGVATTGPGRPAPATTAPSAPTATAPAQNATTPSGTAPATAAPSSTPARRPSATVAAPRPPPTSAPPTETRPTASATRPAPTTPAQPPTSAPSLPTATPVAPTATRTILTTTPTPLPPTVTAVSTVTAPATATPVPTRTPIVPPPTSTAPASQVVALAPRQPTPTSAPATMTATTVPPTATATSPPPTATVVPATATAVPATPIAAPATVTPTSAPPTATATATRRPLATATTTPGRPGQAAAVSEAPSASPAVQPSTAAPFDQRSTTAPASPTVPLPTPTPPVPSTPEAVTKTIGPAGGTIQHPTGGRLEIAEGVFAAPMTVSIAQLPDSALPVSSDVDLIPATGYDVGITAADGSAMTALPAGVVLSLNVPEGQRDDAVVYWIDGDRLAQLGVTNRETSGISAPLAHLSRYVAGVPIEENPELGWLPWAVAVAAALSGLIVVALLAGQTRRQRRATSRRH